MFFNITPCIAYVLISHYPTVPHVALVCPQSRFSCLFTCVEWQVLPLDDLLCCGASVIQPSMWWYTILHHITRYSLLSLSFLAPLGPFLPFSVSISAGYNPCCLCSSDRSLLSANHSSYLTSEMLQYLPFHSQSGVCFQSSPVLMNYLSPPPPLPVPPPSASSLRTEDLRSVFITLLYFFLCDVDKLCQKHLHAGVLMITCDFS